MKPNLHKFLLFFILYSSIGISNAQQTDSTVYNKVKTLHAEFQKEYAPDSRTKLLEMQVEDLDKNEYKFITTEAEAEKKLKEKLQAFPEVTSNIVLLPDGSVKNKTIGIVNLSVANLRTRPSHAAEMATQTLMGTQVDILQKKGGDYRVRTPEGYIAWVPTSSIVAMNEEEIKEWKNAPKIIFTEDFGKSFSTKNTQGNRVSDLVYGNILLLLEEDENFFKVEYPDKRIAYIHKEKASLFKDWLSSRKATQENIIQSAKKMLGIPYLWGGTSVKGVDCSGFTKTSFFMNGIVIPRDASQQILAGEEVDVLDEKGNLDPDKALKNLQPADLLFFAAGKANSPNARVTHVAIYIGDGEFIQSAGTVRINSMLKDAENYDDFQTRTLVGAKRYLGKQDQQIQQIATHKYY